MRRLSSPLLFAREMTVLLLARALDCLSLLLLSKHHPETVLRTSFGDNTRLMLLGEEDNAAQRLCKDRSFLLEILLNHFADRDSQLQQVGQRGGAFVPCGHRLGGSVFSRNFIYIYIYILSRIRSSVGGVWVGVRDDP